MKDWYAFSFADLVHREVHGPILSVKDLAWAPDVAYKKGKYCPVFPAGNGDKDRPNPKNSNKSMGIGVAMSPGWKGRGSRKGIYGFTMPEGDRVLTYYTANSPHGPWKYQVIMEEKATTSLLNTGGSGFSSTIAGWIRPDQPAARNRATWLPNTCTSMKMALFRKFSVLPRASVIS